MIRMRRMRLALPIVLGLIWPLAGAMAADSSFTLFETGQVRPLALSPDGQTLLAVNTPDNRLEILSVDDTGIHRRASVAVGLEPCAVAARTNDEAWVINHLSDSVSIVDLAEDPPRVKRTLLVGDEPRDIVFAGPGGNRAFITTAHRGQNIPFDPELRRHGVGRADVWVFDADQLDESLNGNPRTIIHLFGDTPRALATSADGATVYAAVFDSGNQTTVVSADAVCDGGENVAPCTIYGKEMPGGIPPPSTNYEGIPGPETGIIVKYNPITDAWEDGLARNWNNAIRIFLPDKDVFAIDAMADPPREMASFPHVGTVIFGMTVNPATGTLYVGNSEARNEVRLEKNVVGHTHETRISIVTADGIVSRHLNKHIDYSVVPSPEGVAESSLAPATAIAVDSSGTRLYVASFGSSCVAVFDSESLEDDSFDPVEVPHIALSGGGPSGLVLDEARQRLYALTRFDNSIAVVDTQNNREIGAVPLHNPEPAAIVHGRRFLYDARFTSSNGEMACASCHVFGDFDSLAWDLGSPDLPVLANPNPLNPTKPDPRAGSFHPLKGPMSTQSLRGMAHSGPMHWRGDRTGGFAEGGDPLDERAALRAFNPAFVSLLGRERPLAEEEMESLIDFVLAIAQPPNPIRSLDNALRPDEQAAADIFFDPKLACTRCHVLDPSRGFFGTDGRSLLNPNPGTVDVMKIPHLRNLYQKIGMFGMFPLNLPPSLGLDLGYLGDQIRGFGFLNDGSSIIPPQTEPFLLVFPTNLAPIVGQQITLGSDNSDATTRLDLLIARAAAGECDLVAKGVMEGEARGWYRTASGTFQSDRRDEPAVDDATLRAATTLPGQELTYTCVPPGSGVRIGVDRDEDGFFDRDEIDLGSDPADAASTPPPTATPTLTPTPTLTATPTLTPTATPTTVPCAGDCNGDQHVTVEELVQVVNMALLGLAPLDCDAVDDDGNLRVTIDELVRAVDSARHGCESARP